MLDKTRLPLHVAIIMDGNGRWAERRHIPRLAGHNAGMQAMTEIVRAASGIGIRYLTVYAFSTENWKRTREEVGGIFDLLVKYVASELEELKRENVVVKVFGDYSVIPREAAASLERTLRETAANSGMQFNIALNYGSRAEIVRAANRAYQYILSSRPDKGAADVMDAGKDVMDAGRDVQGCGPFTEELLSRYMYSGEENGNVPDPDLVIRTSGEERLSNFMLWQSAYSELAFTDTLWPDFGPQEFERIIEEYQDRDRRFGGRKK